MTSWHELRAFNLERFQAMKPDLDAYVRGEVRTAVRDAAGQAIEALSSRDERVVESPMREVYLNSLESIRAARGQVGKPASVPPIDSLIAIGFTVPFEASASVDRFEPHCVHLGKNRHTNLYLATIQASPWIYDLFCWNHGAVWPQGDPWTSKHRQVAILDREDVYQFLRELLAVQEVPEWVAECTWGHSKRQFERLFALVCHVANSPSLSVSVDYNS